MDATAMTPVEGIFLILFILITVMSLYQACINLFYGKISRYSIDGILVFLFLKFGTEKIRKRVKTFSKSSDRILLLGVYAVLTFVGGIYALFVWLQRIAK
jgi:Fe2+ transport system protein B